MRAETIKLELIDRLMKIRETSTLEKVEKLITQVEMETRAEESLKAIDKDDVLSIDDFKRENEQWLKKMSTK